MKRRSKLSLLINRIRHHRAYVDTPLGISYAGWFRYTVWDETHSYEVGTYWTLKRAMAKAAEYAAWLNADYMNANYTAWLNR